MLSRPLPCPRFAPCSAPLVPGNLVSFGWLLGGAPCEPRSRRTLRLWVHRRLHAGALGFAGSLWLARSPSRALSISPASATLGTWPTWQFGAIFWLGRPQMSSLRSCRLTVRSSGLRGRTRFQTIVRGPQPLNSGVRRQKSLTVSLLCQRNSARLFATGLRGAWFLASVAVPVLRLL